MKNTLLRAFGLFTLLYSINGYSQLSVTPNQTAVVLATKLAGNGISISSPTLTCPNAANGLFYSVTTPIIIDSGIVLTTGKAINTVGPESTLASFNNGAAGDAALTALAGIATHDACALEFDFVPNGDTVSFNYQFGSEEYVNSTCGQYNDAFAFFISGPGITGTQNMALVPGTTVPVTVNSINSGVPGPPGFPGFCNITYCTSMGPGSPFTSYFVDNTGGTQVTYKGYTTKLRAVHSVTPCNTYHLKMAVADASNFLYDSGVFIEAGSLKTNNYSFSHSDSLGHTINGIAHTIVKGCAGATVTVLSTRPVGLPHTVSFTYGGTATPGVDFTGPSTAVMPAGDTFTTVTITPIATAVGGPKTIEIYLQSPFACGGGNVDTVVINVIDTPTASIITPDTAICRGTSFQIRATGTTGLDYSWSPSAGLSAVTVREPVTAPTATTAYVMSASYPLAGCAAIMRTINVYVDTANVRIFTPDTSVCQGSSVHIVAAGNPGSSYSWTPGTNLDNPNVQNPTATPLNTTTYSVTATSTGGCPAYAAITITIIVPTISVMVPDMYVCVGASANIIVNGDPTYNYSWTPSIYLDNPAIQNPTSTPEHDVTYTVIGAIPGTPCKATDHVTVHLLPEVIASAGAAKSVCVAQPIELYATPTGNNYAYQWSGPQGFTSPLQNAFIPDARVEYGGIYSVTVTDITTNCLGTATTTVVVGNGSLSLFNVTPDQTIKFGSSLQLNAEGAAHYFWSPDNGTLNNNNINNPIVTPTEKTVYTVYAHDTLGCPDTAFVTIDVSFEDAVLVPTAFTPNGDGLNDRFRISKLGNYKLAEISVFNRWGEVIYHSNDGTNQGWDGTNKGVPADMATYNYLIVLGKPDGDLETRKGSVTLIR